MKMEQPAGLVSGTNGVLVNPKRLESLTPAQQLVLNDVRDEYIQQFNKLEFNEQAARDLVDLVRCGYMKEKRPMIFIVDSPLGAQLLVHVLKQMKEFRDNMWANVWANVWDNVRDNVWANVRANVGDNVWANVEDNVRANVEDNVRDKKITFESFSWYNESGSLGWLSFYDAFTRLGQIYSPNFNEYCSLVRRAGIFTEIDMTGAVIIMRPPKYIRRDNRGRLHCTTGPAIEFADGYRLFEIHGVDFSRQLNGPDEVLYTRMFLDADHGCDALGEILQHDNTTIRAAVLSERLDLLENAPSMTIIDTKKRSWRQNGRYITEMVFDVDLLGQRRRCIKVEMYAKTGEKETHVKLVPRTKETETVDGAQGWRWNMTAAEYRQGMIAES